MEPVTRIEKLEAELKLAKLEDKLVQAKAGGKKASPKLKIQVREARRDYRDNYRTAAAAGAQPATVSTKAVKS